jgi:hypothetical protein
MSGGEVKDQKMVLGVGQWYTILHLEITRFVRRVYLQMITERVVIERAATTGASRSSQIREEHRVLIKTKTPITIVGVSDRNTIVTLYERLPHPHPPCPSGHGSPFPWCYFWVNPCHDHEVLTSTGVLNLPGLCKQLSSNL